MYKVFKVVVSVITSFDNNNFSFKLKVETGKNNRKRLCEVTTSGVATTTYFLSEVVFLQVFIPGFRLLQYVVPLGLQLTQPAQTINLLRVFTRVMNEGYIVVLR